MGLFYEYKVPNPDEQHNRLAALRELISRGIPCIIWGEDALNYVHGVPTALFDQQILVPDDLLDKASSVLQEIRYVQVPFTAHYFDWFGANNCRSPFPRGVLLKDRYIPDDEPNKLEPLPSYVLLLPQSYYGLDVHSKERFQSMVPPLYSSDLGILAPKYHTFLEGLVAFAMNPPIASHSKGSSNNAVFIGYLIRYRVKYEDDDDTPPPEELLPEERTILSELRTEEARWYMRIWFEGRKSVTSEEIQQYKRRKSGTN